MKRFLVLLLDLLSFGITFIIRMLVKRKVLKDQYHFDIDRDGDIDVNISFTNTKDKEE